MITGDHAATAAAIARELDLGDGAVGVLTGADVDLMDDFALRAALPQIAVFARTSPEQNCVWSKGCKRAAPSWP